MLGEAQFLLIYRSDSMTRWLSRLSTIQANGGAVMVQEVFSCHALSLLIQINNSLNATIYLSIVIGHVHPFKATIYHLLPAASSMTNHHCTDHKAQEISNCFHEHDNDFSALQWPAQSPSDSNKAPLKCGRMKDSQHECVIQRLKGTCPTPSGIHARKFSNAILIANRKSYLVLFCLASEIPIMRFSNLFNDHET